MIFENDPRKGHKTSAYHDHEFYGEAAIARREASLRRGWQLEQQLGPAYWFDLERQKDRGISARGRQ